MRQILGLLIHRVEKSALSPVFSRFDGSGVREQYVLSDLKFGTTVDSARNLDFSAMTMKTRIGALAIVGWL